MRYEARITAYDMLDRITVAATLWETAERDDSTPEPLLRTVITVPGEGITDPRLWLRDALLSLVETL